MFAKLAKFNAFSRRRAARSVANAAPGNDNHHTRHAATVGQRRPRRVLACRWRQVPATGRLECSWQVVPVGTAAEEPGPSCMTGRNSSAAGVLVIYSYGSIL